MQDVRKKSAIGTKVLIGFSIAILAVAIAAIINYSSMNRLVNAVKTIAKPDEKLICLREILIDLEDEEDFARAYSLTQDTQYLIGFATILDSLHRNVADLKVLSLNHPQQMGMAENISELIAARQGLLGRFIEKRKTGLTDQINLTALNLPTITEPEKLPTVDTQQTAVVTEIRPATAIASNTTTTDTFTTGKKSYSLLEWVKGIFGTSKQDEEISQEEIEKHSNEANRITEKAQNPPEPEPLLPKSQIQQPIIDIKDILSQQQSALKEQVQVWSVEQLLLLQQDKELMDKIRSAVGLLEENEMAILNLKAQEANVVANRANRAVGLVGLLGILSTLIFGYLIFADITRSNRLRTQLIEETIRAEKLGKTKEQFLANMSHEIRTPLNAIIGFTEQLSREVGNDKQHRFLNAIQRSSDHLASLVNEILDYSKLESGTLQRQETTFDLHAVVREVYETFKMRAAEKNIWISYHLESSVPQFVKGDALSMKQILINLMSNGVKFTSQGSVDMNCSALYQINETIKIKVAVKDTGMGIPPEMKENIFEEFLQADNDITRKYGGTGLGLAITKKLTEQLNGSIEVVSSQDIGSCFTVTIPFEKATAPGTEGTLALTPLQTSLFKNKSVLIVDDEEMNLMLVQTILENWRVRTDTARNGKEAMDKIRQHEYDLILLDIQMPEMSGQEVAKKIRSFSDVTKKQVPIVALTANLFSGHLREQTESGFNDVLIKPFRERDLYEKMKSIWFTTIGENGTEHIILNDSEIVETEELYSLKYLETASGSNREFVIRMVQSFISNNHRHLRLLNEALEQKNWEIINQVAHKMIPSFRYLMIRKTEMQLKMLENITDRKLQLEDVPDLITKITSATHEVLQSLDERVRELRSKEGQSSAY